MLLEKELTKVKSYTTFWWISCDSFGVIFNRVDEHLDLCYDFYLVVVLCFLFTVRMKCIPPLAVPWMIINMTVYGIL